MTTADTDEHEQARRCLFSAAATGGRWLQIRNATSRHSLADPNPYRRPELTVAGSLEDDGPYFFWQQMFMLWWLQIKNATSRHSLIDQNPYRRQLIVSGFFGN
jgi:hypothetical protein